MVIYSETPFSVTETTNAVTLADFLRELADENKLTFSATESVYGLYLDSVESLDPEATEEEDFIAVLTTDDDPKVADSEYNSYASVVNYDGDKYVSAIVGISDLKLKDGEKYLIKLETYR